jgi:hypothetical protein
MSYRIHRTLDRDTRVVTFAAHPEGMKPEDRETATPLASLTIGVDEIPESLQLTFMLHGLNQKVGDAAAIPRDGVTGRSPTIAEKFAAMQAVADNLRKGVWSARGEGDGTTSGGLLFTALCRVYAGSKTPDDIRRWLAEKTPEGKPVRGPKEQAALRNIPAIAAMIETIKREQAARRPASSVDASTLLAGL